MENFLTDCDDLVNECCLDHGGVIRNVAGDNYILSFQEAHQALVAIAGLYRRWEEIIAQRYGIGLHVSIHKGDINILRSYVYSTDIDTTFLLTRRVGRYLNVPQDQHWILVSQKIKDEVKGTPWEHRLRGLEIDAKLDDRAQAFIKEHGAYRLLVPSR